MQRSLNILPFSHVMIFVRNTNLHIGMPRGGAFVIIFFARGGALSCFFRPALGNCTLKE